MKTMNGRYGGRAKAAAVCLLCSALLMPVHGGAEATKRTPNQRSQSLNPSTYERTNVLKQSRIEQSFSTPDSGGNWSISQYNHPTDNFQIASAMAYVRGYLGGETEYMSWNETVFKAMNPATVWRSLWAFGLARPVERMAFGSAVVENVTVEGFRVVVRLNAPDVWKLMHDRAPRVPETVRQWMLMDALGNAGQLSLSDLPRVVLWLEMFVDETGRFRMSANEQSAFLSTPESDLRDALVYWARNWKAGKTLPRYAGLVGQQIRVTNRTVKLAPDVEMGLTLLGDGKRPSFAKAEYSASGRRRVEGGDMSAAERAVERAPQGHGGVRPLPRQNGIYDGIPVLPGPDPMTTFDPGWMDPPMSDAAGRRPAPFRALEPTPEQTEKPAPAPRRAPRRVVRKKGAAAKRNSEGKTGQ